LGAACFSCGRKRIWFWSLWVTLEENWHPRANYMLPCPTLLDFIKLIIFGEDNKLCSTSLWRFPHPAIIASRLSTNTNVDYI
jgi:hypothetical protein